MSKLLNNAVLAVASLACTSCIVAFADPANADVGAPTAQVSVRTDDLDLGADAGRATAMHRIRVAADRVCPADTARLDVAATRCRDKAVDDAAAALNRQVAVR